ncbi:MAG: histidine phosphatase family protein [Lachnospiraceae bacterium]|nr:histidine phosphatase family protein [Lachnospiraceae bacterium]
MRVLIIRHGITSYNLEHRYQGWSDIHLCREGREMLQPMMVWEQLPGKIYVSPLLRATETADILFPGLPQVEMPGFKELFFGDFEGKNFEELKHNPDYLTWVDSMCVDTCPGGEGRQAFLQRTKEAFEQVLSSGEDMAIIVAHGGTQMAIMHQYLGWDYFESETPNGCGYELLWDGKELHYLDLVDFRKGADA